MIVASNALAAVVGIVLFAAAFEHRNPRWGSPWAVFVCAAFAVCCANLAVEAFPAFGAPMDARLGALVVASGSSLHALRRSWRRPRVGLRLRP